MADEHAAQGQEKVVLQALETRQEMISGAKCRHLKGEEAVSAEVIWPRYQNLTRALQHFPHEHGARCTSVSAPGSCAAVDRLKKRIPTFSETSVRLNGDIYMKTSLGAVLVA